MREDQLEKWSLMTKAAREGRRTIANSSWSSAPSRSKSERSQMCPSRLVLRREAVSSWTKWEIACTSQVKDNSEWHSTWPPTKELLQCGHLFNLETANLAGRVWTGALECFVILEPIHNSKLPRGFGQGALQEVRKLWREYQTDWREQMVSKNALGETRLRQWEPLPWFVARVQRWSARPHWDPCRSARVQPT